MKVSGASIVNVPKHERHFYSMHRAFGRLGMRIFEPAIMELPHWHGHIEINLLSGADMVYEMDNEEVAVKDGQPVIFWAGIPHQLTKISPTGDPVPQLANLYVPLDAFLTMPHIASLQVALLGGALIELPADLIDAHQMQNWYADYRSGEIERAEILRMEMNAHLRRSLLSGLQFLRAPVTSRKRNLALSSSHITQVVTMVRFILENLSKPILNADVTRQTGLHENYALSLFSRTMRVSMKRFIIQMRLIRARAALIESSEPITTVAIESGFSSISQFYDHFSKSYGMTPNAMRRAYTQARLT